MLFICSIIITGTAKRNKLPVSVTRRECGPLCSAESSSDKSLKLSLWRAEWEETHVSVSTIEVVYIPQRTSTLHFAYCTVALPQLLMLH